MAFKLKRKRKPNKKSVLLKRLKELESKKSLTNVEKAEMNKILKLLKKKKTNKIETKKLNNNKNNEEYITTAFIDDTNATLDHYKSAAGSYRRGRIDNRKNLKSINNQ